MLPTVDAWPIFNTVAVAGTIAAADGVVVYIDNTGLLAQLVDPSCGRDPVVLNLAPRLSWLDVAMNDAGVVAVAWIGDEGLQLQLFDGAGTVAGPLRLTQVGLSVNGPAVTFTDDRQVAVVFAGTSFNLKGLMVDF